jgi:glycerol-3-phosphate acyltransferase PlsY
MPVAIALVAAYVIGSINFAIFVGRLHGVDIREQGSGNPGMSNILRTLGNLPAAMVLVGDTMKGVVGAYAGYVAAAYMATAPTDELSYWAFAGGLAAVVGHCYPVFHGFKGGKGVATGLGSLIFTVPLVALIYVVVWAVIARLTKTASVASLVVVVMTIPLAIWIYDLSGMGLVWTGLTIALVVWRHKANIGRMVKGSEQKVPT